MISKIRVPDFNSVTVIGRLTRDPKLGYTQKGQAMCTFDLAVNRNYKDANGEWQKDPTFIPVRVWRDAAARCGERLKKGSPVLVSGRLRMRKWEDEKGQKKTSLEVEANKVMFMETTGGSGEDAPEQQPAQQDEPAQTGQQDEPVEAGQQDEEIPF